MMRNLKAFCLALTAVLAMSGMATSMAQAELTFTGLNPFGVHTPTIFRAAWTEFTEFEFKPTTSATSTVKCTAYSANASASGESKTLTFKPVGSAPKCKFSPAERTTNRHMNSCDFSYNITKKIAEHKYEGTTDIQCTTKGDAIDYEIPKTPPEMGTLCTIKLEEQTGIGPIYYEVHTAIMAPELDIFAIRAEATNVKSITEAESKAAKDCGVTALGTHKTGTLKDNTTVTGLSEEIENSVIVSG